MLDLYTEFKMIIQKFSEGNLDYALCGGLAMAVYGVPRATVDIDLLIPANELPKAVDLVKELGYTIEAIPMRFAKGAIEIYRYSKIENASTDILMVDLLIVTPKLQEVWASRIEIEWEQGSLFVVSREGLIKLKKMRKSGQDLDDIRRLGKIDES